MLALVAGALAPLGLAPFNAWPLVIVSCFGLLLTLQTARSTKQAAIRGWLYGVGLFGVGVSWVYVSIHNFGNAPVPLAAALTALFVIALALLFGLHGYIYKRWLANRRLAVLIGFPTLWVLSEGFRSWFLTGFPWLLAGYAPIDSGLAGWAPIIGVYGLSGFCALTAACLYLIVLADRQQQVKLLALAMFPFISGAMLQQISWTQPGSQAPVRVALVQGNIPQQLKWNPRHRQQIIDRYLSLSTPLLNDSNGTELIIWPETAIPLLYDRALPRLQPFEQALQTSNTGLISGIPYRTPTPASADNPTRFHNSITGLGRAKGLYHKQRLVPFGEYVPLESWLRGLIDFFDLPMSNFSLGAANQPPLLLERSSDDNIRISAYICYEIVYPDLVAETARNSDLLLTISNDSWFGDSLAPHQHLQMARMRALENGRYLIRSTNNGISALINANGKIEQQAPQFEVATLQGEVIPMTGTTPFSRFGSVPIIILCTLLAGLCLRSGSRPCSP